MITLSSFPLGGISNLNAEERIPGMQTCRRFLVVFLRKTPPMICFDQQHCILLFLCAAGGKAYEQFVCFELSEAVVGAPLDKICCQEHGQSVQIWWGYATPWWFKEQAFIQLLKNHVSSTCVEKSKHVVVILRLETQLTETRFRRKSTCLCTSGRVMTSCCSIIIPLITLNCKRVTTQNKQTRFSLTLLLPLHPFLHFLFFNPISLHFQTYYPHVYKFRV